MLPRTFELRVHGPGAVTRHQAGACACNRGPIETTGGQVPTIQTPLTPAQALGAIQAAMPPGTNMTAIALIAAQSAVETAGWTAMHNWNMGNVTPTGAQADSGDWMDQGLPMKYISYPDAVAGATGMVDWLRGHGLFAAASAGDLDSYMNGLRAGCYLGCIGLTDPTGHTVSQDDYDNYRAGIASWMQKLSGVTPEAPPGAPSGWLPSLALSETAKKAAALLASMGAVLGGAYVATQTNILRDLKHAF